MAVVKAQPGQSADQLIRAFQKKVFEEDIMEILKEKQNYEKPAVKRKNLLLANKRRSKKRKAAKR